MIILTTTENEPNDIQEIVQDILEYRRKKYRQDPF